MDMISLKSPREIECMRRAGRLTAQARALAGSMVRPGVTTHEIDTAVRKFIESHGAKPSFLGYSGFPGSACISINEEVIHGIPGPRKLKEGDIVSVDVGAFLDGFHGDCAATFACGQVSDEAMHLIHVPGSMISPTRCSSTWKQAAAPWCGTSWATVWGPNSTSRLRYPTSAQRAMAPGSSRV